MQENQREQDFKLLPGEFDGQFIEHRPIYSASFIALDISLLQQMAPPTASQQSKWGEVVQSEKSERIMRTEDNLTQAKLLKESRL